MNIVAFAGDWHGSIRWAAERIHDLGQQGVKVLLHVGDAGIWPGPDGKRYLDVVERGCARAGVLLLVTPGNHEDWDRIDAIKPKPRFKGSSADEFPDLLDGVLLGDVKWLSEHVAVLPRAHRFDIDSDIGVARTFVSLGGAPSIDFEHRVIGRSWWPNEQMTLDDVDRTIEGGHADVMITHDAPGGPNFKYMVPSVKAICSNGGGWSERALAYAAEGRELVTMAFEGVQPKALVHGHYHAAGSARVSLPQRECFVVSLDCEQTPRNIVRMDLETLRFF